MFPIDMRVGIKALVFAGIVVLLPAVSPAASDAVESCVAERNARRGASLEEATAQCRRYWLPEAEAYSICHESARGRRDACLERAGPACAEESGSRPDGSEGAQ